MFGLFVMGFSTTSRLNVLHIVTSDGNYFTQAGFAADFSSGVPNIDWHIMHPVCYFNMVLHHDYPAWRSCIIVGQKKRHGLCSRWMTLLKVLSDVWRDFSRSCRCCLACALQPHLTEVVSMSNLLTHVWTSNQGEHRYLDDSNFYAVSVASRLDDDCHLLKVRTKLFYLLSLLTHTHTHTRAQTDRLVAGVLAMACTDLF